MSRHNFHIHTCTPEIRQVRALVWNSATLFLSSPGDRIAVFKNMQNLGTEAFDCRACEEEFLATAKKLLDGLRRDKLLEEDSRAVHRVADVVKIRKWRLDRHGVS